MIREAAAAASGMLEKLPNNAAFVAAPSQPMQANVTELSAPQVAPNVKAEAKVKITKLVGVWGDAAMAINRSVQATEAPCPLV